MEAKPNKRPQRYPKTTQAQLDNILKDISEGSTKKHAALANGMSKAHFHSLIAQGIVDLEWGINDSICSRLAVSLYKIEQIEVKKCRNNIVENSEGHKGAQWTLEHAHWREFGKDTATLELAEEIEKIKDEIRKSVLTKSESEELQEEMKLTHGDMMGMSEQGNNDA